MDAQAVLDKAQTLLQEGRSAADRKDWAQAEAKFADALNLGGQLDPNESDLPVVAMLAMAQLSYDRGQKEDAIQRATSAFALSAETEDFSGWQFPLYELMATLFDEMGVPHRAIPFRHILVKLWREMDGSESERTAAAWARLGASFARLGFQEHAARAYTEAAKIDERFRLEHAAALRVASKHEEAEKVYRAALTTLRAQHGSEHLSVAKALDGLAAVYTSAGRGDLAERHFWEAYRIRLALQADTTTDMASAKAHWAQAQMQQGKVCEARLKATEAIDLWRQLGGGAGEADAHESLGLALEAGGEMAAAERECAEALRLMDEHQITDATARRKRLEWKARLLDKLGRHEEAQCAANLAARLAEAHRRIPDAETLLQWGNGPSRD